ncbi:glycosyltransferase family 4 protein [Cytophagaceae bacterium ABcell3]|nr:glycosyltransferase family 4 protein [Cytophagaceae bacterium ABcell3]
MIALSHPTGNANVRNAVNGLKDADMLSDFYTCIAAVPGSVLYTLGHIKPLKEIHRRKYDESLKPFIRMWPWVEIGRMMANKLGMKGLVEHERGVFSVDAVYQNFDARVAKKIDKTTQSPIAGIYAYEDGALASFQAAKTKSIQCLYDLPIGYWRAMRKMLEAEKERWPDWASTLGGFRDSEEKLARKEGELRLADKIFVASSFTAKTLEDFPGTLAPIDIIPYGFPPVAKDRTYTPLRDKGPLKLLFVGGLSQRKGIADVFSVAESLGDAVTLTVVGQGNMDCIPLRKALAKHTYIPSLPHQEVLTLMRNHDVLLFPSLFEGFGLVITEAMSQGTPVITTDRTAGPDLITHGKDGWLIRAGSTAALLESIENILHNPGLVAKTGQAAMETARKRPWKVYGIELSEAIIRQLNTFK